jgi:predicted nuclease of predicted toxin-antitoxin system
MKLLFDHNLSPKLVYRLSELFPNSNHVYHLGLDRVEDRQVWQLRMHYLDIQDLTNTESLGLLTLY